VSNDALPPEAYVAATSSSTLSGKPFTAAQVDLFWAKEKPPSCRAICGRSLMKIGVRSTT
jgi:hypothetical protein